LIEFVEFFGVLSREQLVRYIEDTNKEDEYAEKAVRKWLEVEERIKPVRKAKGL